MMIVGRLYSQFDGANSARIQPSATAPPIKECPTMTPNERAWHLTAADFLAELDTIAEAEPELAAHTLRYIRAEAERGRWQANRPQSADTPYLCLNCAAPWLMEIVKDGHLDGITYEDPAATPPGTSCANCGAALPESDVRELDVAEFLAAAVLAVADRDRAA